MRKIYLLIMILLSLILIACDNEETNVDGLLINEVCLANNNIIANSEYDYYDYIEFYNSTDEKINLKSFTIRTQDHNYKFGECIIEAKAYQLVFFSKDNIKLTDYPYVGFNLSKMGEEIALYRPDGKVCDQVKVPELKENTSYGRYVINGKESFEIINPSPMEKNESKPIYKYVENPMFSLESGFYDENQTLFITSDDNAKIYYTLDSSVPTKESYEYQEPISLKNIDDQAFVLKSRTDLCEDGNRYRGPNYDDKCMVIRAIAISEDGNQSDVITKNYFIDNNRFNDVTVISLVTERENLIDNDKGIYITGEAYDDWVADGKVGIAPKCNFDQTGREWERECNLSMFEGGNLTFSQDCGMRVKGFGGRAHFIKSFNLYARSCYGEKHFINPIFDDVNYTDSFSLKHDRYNYGSRYEKVRDGFVQSLVKDRNVAIQGYKTCVVFLDGEYWESYLMMEKYSDDYIENHYDVAKEDVVMVKEGQLEEGTLDDAKLYASLLKFVSTANLANKSKYAQFKEMVDIDSLIDFYATQAYVNNYDFSYNKNIVLWRSRSEGGSGYADGKWRWMLYDMDMVAIDRRLQDVHGNIENYDYTFNPFTGRFLWAGDLKDDIFLNNLMKNLDFKKQFVTTFMDLANENFQQERVLKLLKEEHNLISGDMYNFFSKRITTIPNYLKEYANLQGELKKLSITSPVEVKLNSIIPSFKDYQWDGLYFTDFELVLTGDLSNISYSGIKVIESSNNKLVFKIIDDAEINIK